MRFFAILVVAVFSFAKIPAQYDITLQIKGLENNKLQLAYYYEDKHYLVGDAQTDKKGKAQFTGDEKLARGIYLIILPEVPAYFDLLIADDQTFSLQTKADNILQNMKVKGCDENEIFFKHQKSQQIIRNQIKLKDSLMQEASGEDSVSLSKELELLYEKSDSLQNKIIRDYPDGFFTQLLRAMKAPEKDKDLWENIDFNETGLIRTPFFVSLINSHIARNIDKGTSNIITANDKLLQKAESNPEMRNYIAMKLLNFYRTHFKTGMNKVFVHLADNYFLNGEYEKHGELPPRLKELITKQRDLYKASFPGEKAKNIKVARMNGDSLSLYDSDAEYIFLYFWSTGCGHCKKSTKVLKENYELLKQKDVEIFALNTNETVLKILRKYNKEHPVPWEILHDIKNNSKFKQYFYVVNAPMMYVLGPDRIIRVELHGEAQIKEYIKRVKTE